LVIFPGPASARAFLSDGLLGYLKRQFVKSLRMPVHEEFGRSSRIRLADEVSTGESLGFFGNGGPGCGAI